MSQYQGPHIHDWHYNEAETYILIGEGRKYRTMRYCKECFFVEEIELNNEK